MQQLVNELETNNLDLEHATERKKGSILPEFMTDAIRRDCCKNEDIINSETINNASA